MGVPTDAPLRMQVEHLPSETLAAAKTTAANLEREHKRRALEREKERAKAAASMADRKMALRLKREKAAKDAEAAKRKAAADATTRARQAKNAELEAERRANVEYDREMRARMQKVLEDNERERRSTPEEIKRMRDAWRARASREPADPYAEWREPSSARPGGSRSAREEEEEEEDDEGDDDEEAVDVADMTEEERQMAELRATRIKERDEGARRILALSSRTFHDALGLEEDASDADIDSRVRKLLRLLHPDYSINLSIKGTRKQQRIEAAYKRLNGLRNDALV